MNNNPLVLLGLIFGFFTTIFWMVVGWRAMRAHERLAEASEEAASKMREPQ